MRVIPVTVLPCLYGTKHFPRALGRKNGNVQAVHSIGNTAPSCAGHVLMGDPSTTQLHRFRKSLGRGVKTNVQLRFLSLRRLSSRTARSVRVSRSWVGSRDARSSLSASERPFWKHTMRDSLLQPLPAEIVRKWMAYSAAVRLPCWRDSSHLDTSKLLIG